MFDFLGVAAAQAAKAVFAPRITKERTEAAAPAASGNVFTGMEPMAVQAMSATPASDAIAAAGSRPSKADCEGVPPGPGASPASSIAQGIAGPAPAGGERVRTKPARMGSLQSFNSDVAAAQEEGAKAASAKWGSTDVRGFAPLQDEEGFGAGYLRQVAGLKNVGFGGLFL